MRTHVLSPGRRLPRVLPLPGLLPILGAALLAGGPGLRTLPAARGRQADPPPRVSEALKNGTFEEASDALLAWRSPEKPGFRLLWTQVVAHGGAGRMEPAWRALERLASSPEPPGSPPRLQELLDETAAASTLFAHLARALPRKLRLHPAGIRSWDLRSLRPKTGTQARFLAFFLLGSRASGKGELEAWLSRFEDPTQASAMVALALAVEAGRWPDALKRVRPLLARAEGDIPLLPAIVALVGPFERWKPARERARREDLLRAVTEALEHLSGKVPERRPFLIPIAFERMKGVGAHARAADLLRRAILSARRLPDLEPLSRLTRKTSTDLQRLLLHRARELLNGEAKASSPPERIRALHAVFERGISDLDRPEDAEPVLDLYLAWIEETARAPEAWRATAPGFGRLRTPAGPESPPLLGARRRAELGWIFERMRRMLSLAHLRKRLGDAMRSEGFPLLLLALRTRATWWLEGPLSAARELRRERMAGRAPAGVTVLETEAWLAAANPARALETAGEAPSLPEPFLKTLSRLRTRARAMLLRSRRAGDPLIALVHDLRWHHGPADLGPYMDAPSIAGVPPATLPLETILDEAERSGRIPELREALAQSLERTPDDMHLLGLRAILTLRKDGAPREALAAAAGWADASLERWAALGPRYMMHVLRPMIARRATRTLGCDLLLDGLARTASELDLATLREALDLAAKALAAEGRLEDARGLLLDLEAAPPPAVLGAPGSSTGNDRVLEKLRIIDGLAALTPPSLLPVWLERSTKVVRRHMETHPRKRMLGARFANHLGRILPLLEAQDLGRCLDMLLELVLATSGPPRIFYSEEGNGLLLARRLAHQISDLARRAGRLEELIRRAEQHPAQSSPAMRIFLEEARKARKA